MIAPHGDQIFGQAAVPCFTGCRAQTHQGHFDDFVATVAVELSLVRPKNAVHMICQATCHVQKAPLSGSLVIAHTRLYHMPKAIQLMGFRICPFLFGAHQLIVGVQVSIGVLRPYDGFNNGVGGLFQQAIRSVLQYTAHSIQPLCQVRILVGHT